MKIHGLVESMELALGVERETGVPIQDHYFEVFNVLHNIGPTFELVSATLTMVLMTVFFVFLLLAG